MSKVEFVPRRFEAKTRELIDKGNELLESEYAGMRITLRQLWYRFIGLDLIPDSWADREYNLAHGLPPDTKNNQRNYKHFGSIFSDARLAGLVDWDSIEDRGRRATEWQDAENIKSAVKEAIERFRLPRWKGQPIYAELWCEKDALASFLEPIAYEYHCPILINKGYSSSSALYDSARRIADGAIRFGEWAEARGPVPAVVLYVGDHDPSGEDMVRDLDERLKLFLSDQSETIDLEVRKVALTMAQVRKYKLPPNPAKPPPPKGGGSKMGTDARSRAYTAEHGNKSWEVDALEPRVLQRTVRDALDSVIDKKLMREIREREDAQREAVEDAIDEVLERLGGDSA